MDIKLRDYQIKGIDFLNNRNGLLCFDCGLGKTVTAIKAIDNDIQGLVLWLCKKSAVTQVKNEFLRYSSNVENVISAIDFLKGTYESNNKIVVIAYYQQLLKLQLDSFFWDWVVADEAHTLRNIKTKTFTAAHKILSRRRIGLTATPAKREVGYQSGKKTAVLSPPQMYGMLKFLYPQKFKSRLGFLNQYWEQIGWDGYAKNCEDYNKMLSEIILVVDANSADIPAVNEIVVDIEPNKREYALYKELKKQAAADIVINIPELNNLDIITTKAVVFMRLQQLTSMPQLLGNNTIYSSKMGWLDDNIQELCESGVVIMTRFIETARVIAKRYGLALHIGERKDIIIPEETMGIVGTASSIGESLDLWWLKYAVLYDQIWAGWHRQQALSRIRRLRGIEQPKIVFDLLMTNTIDKYIHNYSLNSAIPLNELKQLLQHIKEIE